MDTKKCKTCLKTKHIDDFNRSGKGSYRAHCKKCMKTIHREQKGRGHKRGSPPRLDKATGVMVKKCLTCEMELTLDYYRVRVGRMAASCKLCEQKAQKVRYDANPEKYRLKAKEYAQRNPDKIKGRRERWYATNRSRMLTHYREYHARPEVKARGHQREVKRWANRTPEQRRAHYAAIADGKARYMARNRHKYNEAQGRYRSRKANSPQIERVNYRAIVERDASRCYLCGHLAARVNLAIDHVIPISRGGTHTTANLRVTHKRCNTIKGKRLVTELAGRVPADWDLQRIIAEVTN